LLLACMPSPPSPPSPPYTPPYPRTQAQARGSFQAMTCEGMDVKPADGIGGYSTCPLQLKTLASRSASVLYIVPDRMAEHCRPPSPFLVLYYGNTRCDGLGWVGLAGWGFAVVMVKHGEYDKLGTVGTQLGSARWRNSWIVPITTHPCCDSISIRSVVLVDMLVM
jgi:hypothetical protein